MRIAVDATPAITQTAGVGRYTRELLKALVQLPDDDQYHLVAAASDERCRRLLRQLPPGAWREIRRLPVGERAMTAAWQRLRLPIAVDRLVGAFDVYHGTDFALPPTRKPAVVTIHDLSYLHFPQYAQPELVEYLTLAVPRALHRADAVITVSASVAAEVADAYPFAADRLVAIPNGVETIERSPRQQLETDRPVVLTIGTIEPRKNHLALLDAMRHVWETYPDAKLVIAGRAGWRSDDIVPGIRAAVATGRVIWHESIDDAGLEDLYAQATAFVYPSAYEGFGLPVLEAMARGIPVVTSNVAALRETAGDAALYAEPGDHENLAARIMSILDDRAISRELIERGHQRAPRFSWRETALRTHRTYQRIVEGERR